MPMSATRKRYTLVKTNEERDMGPIVFQCCHCMRLICESEPVYMMMDGSYCSEGCQRKGEAAAFRFPSKANRTRGPLLHHLRAARRPSCSHFDLAGCDAGPSDVVGASCAWTEPCCGDSIAVMGSLRRAIRGAFVMLTQGICILVLFLRSVFKVLPQSKDRHGPASEDDRTSKIVDSFYRGISDASTACSMRATEENDESDGGAETYGNMYM
mmetsp:Transcript_101478/g.286254  ORF Transcript_101478/g.286254 Transcript_101478/m.286254 type:complete len:212 (+) Transcript_101478:82-717(+)|eukprot:CAMPEP_0117549660 /NCGR_PEP_ID=MMETSP0784-20121206/48279_1 /TAXON_ID=39447 /ORGANISM="" /LENGTH=211 /DNA_ID=CAMNT_0005346653 /DNA_START=66 /DNA_END=701 /DNA_ORIENTATION=-